MVSILWCGYPPMGSVGDYNTYQENSQDPLVCYDNVYFRMVMIYVFLFPIFVE